MRWPVTIFLRLSPHPQGRPKARAQAGHAQVYERKADREFKAMVRGEMLHCLEGYALPLIPIGPVHLDIYFDFPLPASLHRKTKPRTPTWHTKRGDLTNLVKAIEDAANGLLWTDDQQVAELYTRKMVCGQEMLIGPGIRVVVRPLGESEA